MRFPIPTLSVATSIKWAASLAALAVLASTAASAQGTLRIGMTASDIPLTTGQTDQGGEGMRFMGYTVYDALINWDLTSADKASDIVPGLATSWAVDPADKTYSVRPLGAVGRGALALRPSPT